MQRLPSVRLAWLVHEITDEVLTEASAAGIQQLCPRANIVTESAVAKALQAGFSVRGWGIKDDEVSFDICTSYDCVPLCRTRLAMAFY